MNKKPEIRVKLKKDLEKKMPDFNATILLQLHLSDYSLTVARKFREIRFQEQKVPGPK